MVKDEDLRAALGEVPEQPRAPTPLTGNQRVIIQRLLRAHGSNVDAMARDRKTNKMLLTAAKLRRMILAYQMYPDGHRVAFNTPKKGL